MLSRAEKHTLHYQIGVVKSQLYTPIRKLRKEYASLYKAFAVTGPQEQAIRIDVIPVRSRIWHRKYYEITVNGGARFLPGRYDEILPHVEWAMNWEVPKVMPQYLQLHASSMEIDGFGIIFPGDSGFGKSTLTAGLLARGWKYLCDEFALIHTDTLMLHPYPRAICLKRPSYPVIESLGLKLHARPNYWKGSKGFVGFVNPLEVRPDAIGRVCPIRYVIFPRYTPGAKPALIPVSRAEAAFDLHRVCFNLFGCNALGVDVLASMIRSAQCYRMISGEIKETCELVQNLIRHQCKAHARSA